MKCLYHSRTATARYPFVDPCRQKGGAFGADPDRNKVGGSRHRGIPSLTERDGQVFLPCRPAVAIF